MLKVVVSPLLFSAIAFTGAPVSAQLKPEVPTGTRIKADLSRAPIEETRQVMADFARCTVKRHPREARAFLLDPSKSWADKSIRKLADGNCLTDLAMRKNAQVALSLPGDTMRYGLAEALVNAELPVFQPQLIERAQPLVHPTLNPAEYAPKPGKTYNPEQLKKFEETKQRAEFRIALSKYGECVVRSDAANSHRLLMTKPTSPEERSAFQALMPGFAQCVQEGAQFKSNRTILRGVVALNFYRLAHAPKLGPAVGAPR